MSLPGGTLEIAWHDPYLRRPEDGGPGGIVKLLRAGLWGYRRFEADHGDMDLAGDVIAIVGSNEAGKTSFLEALRHLSNEEEFAASELTRKGNGEACVRATFALEEADRQALDGVQGRQDVRALEVWMREGSDVLNAKTVPALTRDRGPRRRLHAAVERAQRLKWLAEGREAISQALEAVLPVLTSEEETLTAEQQTALKDLAIELDDIDDLPASLVQLRDSLWKVREHEAQPHPGDVVAGLLRKRLPSFLMFSDQHRHLDSQYDIAAQHPRALRNLARLAGLDLQGLKQANAAGDQATVAELITAANERLQRYFSQAWTQAKVIVRFHTDAGMLHVFASNKPGTLIPLTERSAGMRQFVALVAFVEQSGVANPVLLVDEAETHLHYDAQADLVNVFSEQRLVSKVIYTTHSAGCLPQDLGMGVRMIEACGPEGADPGEWDRSRIRNWFWTDRGGQHGFSPLFMAMRPPSPFRRRGSPWLSRASQTHCCYRQ